MIKIIVGGAILLIAGIAWVRMQWAIDKNKKAANKIIQGLQNGTYSVESFEESLGMMIRSRQLPAHTDLSSRFNRLTTLTNTKLKDKFNVLYATTDQNKAIVIAEGTIKSEFSAATEKEVDVVYPCWMYMEIDPTHSKIHFKSSMPDGKDHHYLLEDIADTIYDQYIS